MSKQEQVSNDAEDYITKTKQKASKVGKVEEKIAAIEDSEVARLSKEVDKVRLKRTLDDLKKGLNSDTGTMNPILSSIFVGKTPTEIDEILTKMTPEAISRLQLIITKLDPTANLIASATAQQQPARVESDFERALAIIKLMKEMQPAPAPVQPQQQITVTDVVKIIEMVRGGQGGGQMSSFEALKQAAEIYKPFLDAGSQKDKEIFSLRMKELESKLPQDPIETIRYVKEVAKDLGLSSGQRSEVDLQLEKMKQDREVDMKRLDWEQRKYEMEQEGDIAKWEQIGKILQGPIGQAIQGIGNAGADRVRGAGGNPRKTGRQPTAVQTQCPNCQSVIYVDAEADTAVCGHCGAILQKQGVPVPQQAPQEQPQQPEPTRVEDKPSPAPAVQQAEAQEEEEQEEEQENGPDETEGTESTTS